VPRKAFLFHQAGEPADVLTLEDFSVPEPAANEVLIGMRLAPINPSDLLANGGLRLPAATRYLISEIG
jgi:NADPH:quinone reductase-like Zn-dependent oxidoreductase